MAFDDTFGVGGQSFSLRMVYVHMIGSTHVTTGHAGHAGLLRERIDGVLGR